MLCVVPVSSVCHTEWYFRGSLENRGRTRTKIIICKITKKKLFFSDCLSKTLQSSSFTSAEWSMASEWNNLMWTSAIYASNIPALADNFKSFVAQHYRGTTAHLQAIKLWIELCFIKDLQIHMTKCECLALFLSGEVRKSLLSPSFSVWRLLCQCLVYGDHHLLWHIGAQAVRVVQGNVAQLHQSGPLTQPTCVVCVVRDTFYLSLAAAGNSTRAKHPVWHKKGQEVRANGDKLNKWNLDNSRFCPYHSLTYYSYYS